MNMFAIASRKKFRFQTPQGLLTTEDLWNIPLTSKTNTRANLDDIAIALNKEIKGEGETASFVNKTVKTNEDLQTKFAIVLHVIETRQAEAAELSAAKEKADKKQQIMQIIARKQDDDLASKSVEELSELLKNL